MKTLIYMLVLGFAMSCGVATAADKNHSDPEICEEAPKVTDAQDDDTIFGIEFRRLRRRYPNNNITDEWHGPLGGGVRRWATPGQRGIEIRGPFGLRLFRRIRILQ